MNNFTGRKKILLFFLVSGFLFFGLCVPAVLADQYGFESTAGRTPLKSLTLSKSSPEALAKDIVQKSLFFVGTIFFLLLLYAGFLWMIARGQSQKVDTAKQILETAIIGLAIVSLSYAVSTYIFTRLTTPTTTTTSTVEVAE